ncbi:DUF6443 domain-containing protein [Chitinophaga rhizophila]|uniref:DUF6443 domain-containing protein n=1 Tax=Chitinophaga rhizophila TaxID=2866212 RepID=A0ABS7GH44_9BACT|nr:DUF6443 domain-containing protein [Chitinophaga rhizophila]MBW8687012.1 hypothetical protein [Chitinophaga rhizophila]
MPLAPVTDTNWITNPSRSASEVKLETQYFDGLGRILQTINRKGSPNGKDVVTPYVYDDFGREIFNYLPYAQQSGNQNGVFKTAPFKAQQMFYRNAQLMPGTGADSIYYTQTLYEASPLDRVLQSWSVGNSWAKEGGNRPVTQQYATNSEGDAVRYWTSAAQELLPVTRTSYAPGTLYKEVSSTESGVIAVTYRDLDGRIILKKTQLANKPDPAHTGWLCTYYVYDDVGNLQFIIPPKAVDLIKSSWAISAAIVEELCFIYTYDSRLRLIVQKVPGADSIELVYDRRDRLVARRDGNMKRMGQWFVISYDAVNREQVTALVNLTDSRATLQAKVNELMPGQRDVLSLVPSSQTRVLTNTWYDNYTFPESQSYVTTDISKVTGGANPYAIPLPATASSQTQGRITGRRYRVEATDQFLTSTMHYDKEGRVIQTNTGNIAGGRDVINTLYDFSGKVLSTYHRHTNLRSKLTPQTTVLTMNHYDAMGRIDTIKIRINDNPALQRLIAVNTYDELGRLDKKRLDVTSPTEQLETLDYEYTIRGWLKSINGSYVNKTDSKSAWFGQEYCYDQGFDNAEFSGNIAGVKWKSASDQVARAYGFSYDKADQLKYAGFTQQNEGSIKWTNDKVDFSVGGLAYDFGGNILSMTQVGLDGLNICTIDSLQYGYFPNSNRLNYVTDKRNDPSSTLGDFKEADNRAVQDYWYDANGNIAKDKNKAIDTVMYNYQQLPAIVFAKGKKASIHYLYAAGKGELLAKMVADTSVRRNYSSLTHYINGFQYHNDSLQFIIHEEGRIRPIYRPGQPVTYTFDYFLKDNLGNIRMVLGSSKDIAIYRATMEPATAAVETVLFSNIDNTRTVRPVGYPAGAKNDSNNYVARLNAENGQKIGPSLVLRVMAGDSISVGVNAFYKQGAAKLSHVTPDVMIGALFSAFGLPTGVGKDALGLSTEPVSSGFAAGLSELLKRQDASQTLDNKPRAYLCYAAFDEQLNIVDQNAGVNQIAKSPDVLQVIVSTAMRIQKNGYIYIYTNNESAHDVYFDNLTVKHITGPLLEETHYYPFGLTMAGISSCALKGSAYPINRKGYNGITFNTDLDLNEYDAFYRTLDPQIGRWKQLDPKIDKMEAWSPYVSNFNNPVRYSDFLGDEPFPGLGLLKGVGVLFNVMLQHLSKQAAINRGDNIDAIRGVVNKGIDNFKRRIETGHTTPELIYNELKKNPFSAITGLGGLELRAAAVATEKLVFTSKAVSRGAKVAENTQTGMKLAEKLDGAGRAAKYSGEWEGASLKEAIEKFAPGAEGVAGEFGGKTLYLNQETGIQIVYDNSGNYFRVQNTKISGERVYLDLNGKIPNNKIVNGKQIGRSKREYNQVTHFNNID